MSSGSWSFVPPLRSDPRKDGEEVGLSSDRELDIVEELAVLELGDEVWVALADVVVPALEVELIGADELIKEVAEADEEDVVTIVEVEASDEVVLELADAAFMPLELFECLSRALCKASPRPRAPTRFPMDCSISSFG